MSAVLAALLAVAAAESQEAREAELLPKGVQVIHSPDAAPRTGYELRDAIRRALKRWARPDDQEAQEAAKEFVALYIELERDTKLARSQREKLKARLRYRLLALRDQIARWVAVQRRLEREHKRKEAGRAQGNRDSLAGQPGSDQALLEQSPARGGGAVGAADYGQMLVDLIQRTVRPETWDVNGGAGSIFYWYPGKALVVRQTEEVHEELRNLLEQLRRL